MEQIKEELIGLNLKVIDSKNITNKGIKGTIIDETKNTITIKLNKKEKKLIKNQNTYEIEFENGKKTIQGDLLVARPQDRIKFKVKKI